VSVKFVGYENQEVTTLGSLKLSNSAGGAAGPSSSGIVNKKEMLAKQKEYLKKRKQKKQDRFKKLEQVCKIFVLLLFHFGNVGKAIPAFLVFGHAI